MSQIWCTVSVGDFFNFKKSKNRLFLFKSWYFFLFYFFHQKKSDYLRNTLILCIDNWYHEKGGFKAFCLVLDYLNIYHGLCPFAKKKIIQYGCRTILPFDTLFLKIILSSFSKHIFQKGSQIVRQWYKSELWKIFFEKELFQKNVGRCKKVT